MLFNQALFNRCSFFLSWTKEKSEENVVWKGLLIIECTA